MKNPGTHPAPAAEVGIVILNWNGTDQTLRCLRSLTAVAEPEPRFEVVIVDNGSRDAAAELVKRAPEFPFPIRFHLNPENVGFAQGCNLGFEAVLESGCRYLLLLNNDTLVTPTFLGELVRTLTGDPGAVAAAPRVLYLEDPRRLYTSFDRPNLWLWTLFPTTRGRLDPGGDTFPREVESIVGCAVLLRAKTVSREGLFDPEFFAYYEEVDLFLRLRARGYRLLYVPQSVVYHEGEASLGKASPVLAYLKMRNLILLMRKRGRRRHWLTFLPILAAVFQFRVARAILSGDAATALALFRAVLWHFGPLRLRAQMENRLSATDQDRANACLS